jgi:hypothetical protein
MLLRDELDQTLEMAEKQYNKQLSIFLGLKKENENLKLKTAKLVEEIKLLVVGRNPHTQDVNETVKFLEESSKTI